MDKVKPAHGVSYRYRIHGATRHKKMKPFLTLSLALLLAISGSSQNPFVTDQFTADPTARVFGDRVYVYPSHDIPCTPTRGRVGWFCMQDYHVFSSPDLTNWTDHGVIVSQDQVSWVDTASYSMWAPDCVMHRGKYYFYFPARTKDTLYGKGFAIGVAISDHPVGPFAIEPAPIRGVSGIDPNVFIDHDGQAYLYWAAKEIFVAKLKDNMLELDTSPQVIPNLPDVGLKEGPFVFERNGIYYLTYPHVENKTERLEYAIADNPLGPFVVKGVIMKESPECWTNHQSIVQFKDQWYLFYHFNDLSPDFDKNRSIRIDKLFFNADGTIQEVTPTLRGVGITPANSSIQIDRYSQISDQGVHPEFLDSTNRFAGWKIQLSRANAWIRYNDVDFGKGLLQSVRVSGRSESGGKLSIYLDQRNGQEIGQITIPAGKDWATLEAQIKTGITGIHHLIIQSLGNNTIELDWIQFQE